MICDIAKNGSSILLKARLPGGLYIVKFTGAKVNERRIVTTM